MKYVWQLFSLGDLSRLELMHPTGPGSSSDGFLKNREGGVHHITLETPDIIKFGLSWRNRASLISAAQIR